jgi:FliI/YscN family ATPase
VTSAAVLDALGAAAPLAGGYVTAVRGLLAEADALALPIGALVELETSAGMRPAEVVGFRDGRLQLMPLAPMRGIAPGCRVWPLADVAAIGCGEFLLGRVVDPLGRPTDGGPAFPEGSPAPLYRAPVQPLERPILSQALDTGVRALDAATVLARGQRVGLFAGAGVGKSTLLGMLVRGTAADVRVIGLVGERGREVREFVERELGPARAHTVVVAVPSDAPPLLRTRGAWAATAIAEWFRDQGLDVLLVMDSLTRFALAAREIGLARGEPATTKGYTPSVFVELPQLLERAGRLAHGSITGIYSVLVEGNDLSDPVADALLAILDGHIVLSRELAERGHYPAVDVLASVSRAMPAVTERGHRDAAGKLRRLLAAYRDSEDLIQVGAYKAGSDPVVDEAIARRGALEAFLRQDTAEVSTLAEALAGLRRALGEAA